MSGPGGRKKRIVMTRRKVRIPRQVPLEVLLQMDCVVHWLYSTSVRVAVRRSTAPNYHFQKTYLALVIGD